MGFPEPAFGVGRVLEALLREECEGLDVEVINVAMTADELARRAADRAGVRPVRAGRHSDLFRKQRGRRALRTVIGFWGFRLAPANAKGRYSASGDSDGSDAASGGRGLG